MKVENQYLLLSLTLAIAVNVPLYNDDINVIYGDKWSIRLYGGRAINICFMP